jgi:hypothetical protein
MPCPDHGAHCPDGLSLDDAAYPYETLQAEVPITSRFPDHRVLFQTVVWLTSKGEAIPLDEMHVGDVEDLVAALQSDALEWHCQAASDEWYATSSAMRWAYQCLDVLMIGETHPQVWLASTPLIREMKRRVDAARSDT